MPTTSIKLCLLDSTRRPGVLGSAGDEELETKGGCVVGAAVVGTEGIQKI